MVGEWVGPVVLLLFLGGYPLKISGKYNKKMISDSFCVHVNACLLAHYSFLKI